MKPFVRIKWLCTVSHFCLSLSDDLKMKIGIHNDPRHGGLGGSEVCVAVLAEALAKDHQVEILHHRPDMTPQHLARFANVDLNSVTLRLVDSPALARPAGNFWSRHRAEQTQDAELSNAYDLFITFTHSVPPYCAAPTGVLVVLFPLFDFNGENARNKNQAVSEKSSVGIQLASLWRKWKWKSRFRSYQVKLTISEFTRRWTKRRWNIESQIVFPPVNVDVQVGEKTNRILSVGRFAVSGHGKKQIEMLRIFKQLRASGHPDWQYDCAGGCGDSREEQDFLKKVTQLGAECKACILANVGHAQLRRLYQQAKIFWHAAGMDVDENLHPELAEHFGITTVEAMAAGCVPIVVNKGGQPEIVEHGVSGFLWNTPEECQEYTARLMIDDALLQTMSRAARDRAQRFSCAAYLNRFRSLLAPYLDTSEILKAEN